MNVPTSVGRSRRARLACLALSTALASGLATPALGQTAPPLNVDVDANGMDLVSGNYVTSIEEGSIGSGEGAVSLVRSRSGAANWVDNWSGGLFFQSSGSTQTAYILFGSVSAQFTVSGSSYTPVEADGSSLVANGFGYLYTARDGTKIQFNSTAAGATLQGFACANYTNSSCSIPVSITRPNGMVFTLNWTTSKKCISGSGPSCPALSYYRLDKVTSSAGYGFQVNYVTNTVGSGAAPQTNWYNKTTVSFFNINDPLSTGRTVTYLTPSADYPDFTDPGGHTWRFQNGIGVPLTGIQRPGASTYSTTISTSGATTTINRDGVATSYARVVSGNTATTTITDAATNQTIVEADLAKARITKITNVISPANLVTTFAYDANSRLIEVTSPEGDKLQYAYDGRGNVTSTTRKAKPTVGGTDIVTTADYSLACSNVMICNQPTWTRNANNKQTDYTYDSTTGLVSSVTAPAPTAGAVRPQTRYAYGIVSGTSVLTSVSACQTTASCVGGADETKVNVTYNANLLPTSVTTEAGDSSLSATRAMTYDKVGNSLTVDGPLAGAADTVTYRWSSGREQLGVISPDPDGSGPLPRQAVRSAYNADGQVITTELGTVAGTTDSDWAAFASAQQVTSSYDANARAVRQDVTAGGTTYGVTQASYDAAGRLDCNVVRMNPAVFASLPGACTASTAGTAGPDRITRVTQYDALNRAMTVTSSYGTTAAAAERVVFTANGRITELWDGENNPTSYQYDGFDRVLAVFYPTQNHTGSNLSDYEAYGYDAAGNVVIRRLRDGTSITYGFDALNRLVGRELPGGWAGTGGSAWAQSYSYDLLGRLTGVNDPNNAYTHYVWDALGRKVSEDALYGGTRTMAYDLAGRRTRLTWSDGFYVSYAYDIAGNPLSVSENGTTTLATFAYDGLGRRIGATLGNGASSSYAYDLVGRLNTLGHDLSGTTADLSVGYTYNPAGQIATRVSSNDAYSWTGYANGTGNYTADGLNRYSAAAGVTPTYDARGNTTSIGGMTYGYSAANALTTFTGGYIYRNALDQRLDVSTEAQSAVYDGDFVIEEASYGGAINRRYVYAPGENTPLVWYEGSGTTNKRWLHTDERGSVIAVSDGTGAALAINRYDEYGQPASGNLGRFGYTGQQWIAGVGLWDYKARMYSPSLSRFMQTDPIGYADGLNWYNYVGSDPVNRIDPFGLADQEGPEVTVCAGIPVGTQCLSRAQLARLLRSRNSSSGFPHFGSGGSRLPNSPALPRTSTESSLNTMPRVCYGPPQGPKGSSATELAAQAKQNGDQAAQHSATDLGWFRSQVQNNGPWDYKQYDRSFQDYGNYNYGYTGARQGIPSSVLRAGAGFAQVQAGTSNLNFITSAFDDPRDQEQINRGINDAQNGCY